MKGLLYLVGLIAVVLAVTWYGFGIHPQTIYNRIVGSVAGHTQDVKNTGSRFGDVIKNNYNDQDMTQPMTH